LIELQTFLNEQEIVELDCILDSLQPPPILDADSAIDWIQTHFYLYDTAELMRLYPVQRRILKHAFERDDTGYRYHTVIVSMPKKSAKSSLIAAVCDYVAQHKPRSSIKLLGHDLKQADSRVGMYVREAIRLGQKRRDPVRRGIKIKPSGYSITYPNGSRIEMVPIDPRGEAGGNDDLIVYSELWGWKHKAHQDMWAEMTLSPNKFGQAQRWIDTYAGFSDGGSPILESLYKQVVQDELRIDPELELYAHLQARIFCAWVTKPTFPWQTAAYYTEQAATLTPAQYTRMHENGWISESQAFIPIEWWTACAGTAPALTPDQPVVIGVDAAVTSDCFALVMVSRAGTQLATRYVKVWVPPKGGEIDFDEPEQELRRLFQTYNVVQVAYDPNKIEHMMQRLRAEGMAWCKSFPQGQKRLIADKRLHDIIRDREIVHQGEPDLIAHIKNANVNLTGDDDKLRIVKRSEDLKVDAVVALSMACYEALRLNIG
jgi:phage terminase large subunit-like protein